MCVEIDISLTCKDFIPKLLFRRKIEIDLFDVYK